MANFKGVSNPQYRQSGDSLLRHVSQRHILAFGASLIVEDHYNAPTLHVNVLHDDAKL